MYVVPISKYHVYVCVSAMDATACTAIRHEWRSVLSGGRGVLATGASMGASTNLHESAGRMHGVWDVTWHHAEAVFNSHAKLSWPGAWDRRSC
jgi:hypothetical protein